MIWRGDKECSWKTYNHQIGEVLLINLTKNRLRCKYVSKGQLFKGIKVFLIDDSGFDGWKCLGDINKLKWFLGNNQWTLNYMYVFLCWACSRWVVWQLVTQIKCNVVVMPCIEQGCTNDQLTGFEYTNSICINCLLSMEIKHIHTYKYISKMLKIIVGRFSCNH